MIIIKTDDIVQRILDGVLLWPSDCATGVTDSENGIIIGTIGGVVRWCTTVRMYTVDM